METTGSININLPWNGSLAIVFVAFFVFMYQKNHRYVHRACVLIQAIKNRHEPFDDRVWEEKDVETLLMKVIAKTSRSMGVTFMLWPERQFWGTALGYLYFRVVDTFADDLRRRDHKVRSMTLMKERMHSLKKGLRPGPLLDDCEEFDFLLDTPKQKSYRAIVAHLHVFDPLWFRLSDRDQTIVYEYICGLIDGNLDLLDKNGSARLTAECATAIELGFTHGLLRAFDLDAVSAHLCDERNHNQEHRAWKSWAMAICLSQMMTIESDLAEHICFDDALLPMLGGDGDENIDPAVVARVRLRYIRAGLDHYTQTLPLFLYEPIVNSIGLRLMILQFTVVALNVYERELGKVGVLPKRKVNVWWVMLKTTVQSVVSTAWYQASITNQIERAKTMLSQCPAPPPPVVEH